MPAPYMIVRAREVARTLKAYKPYHKPPFPMFVSASQSAHWTVQIPYIIILSSTSSVLSPRFWKSDL